MDARTSKVAKTTEFQSLMIPNYSVVYGILDIICIKSRKMTQMWGNIDNWHIHYKFWFYIWTTIIDHQINIKLTNKPFHGSLGKMISSLRHHSLGAAQMGQRAALCAPQCAGGQEHQGTLSVRQTAAVKEKIHLNIHVCNNQRWVMVPNGWFCLTCFQMFSDIDFEVPYPLSQNMVAVATTEEFYVKISCDPIATGETSSRILVRAGCDTCRTILAFCCSCTYFAGFWLEASRWCETTASRRKTWMKMWPWRLKLRLFSMILLEACVIRRKPLRPPSPETGAINFRHSLQFSASRGQSLQNHPKPISQPFIEQTKQSSIALAPQDVALAAADSVPMVSPARAA